MAAADAGIVLNQLSNFKLKSGIAPVCDMRDRASGWGSAATTAAAPTCRAYSRR